MKTELSNDELIAKFMNYTIDNKHGLQVEVNPKGKGPGMEPYFTKPLFDTSWDWLMPVVEKIESLGYHVTIMKTRTIIAITSNVQNHIQSIHPGYSRIEVTYCAVLEFIRWYNEQ